jgi:tetratricopeptide (TPR) repeat protein
MFDRVASDPRRFGAAAAALVRRARQVRQPEALVHALRAHAWAERARLAAVPAKKLLDEAATLARRHALAAALADVLMSRAAVHQELGRAAAARRDLDQAERALAATPDGDAGRAGELAFQRAILDQNSGRLAAAADSYRYLLGAPGTPPRTWVIAANNLAIIDAEYGRHPDALESLDAAARRAADVGPAVVALVAQTTAWVTVRAGRLAEGLRRFEAAAHAYAAADLPLGEHYVEYADALMDLRLIPEARRAARAAAAEFRHGAVDLMGAEAELRVAQLALLSGDLAEAESAAAAAIASFARQRRSPWKARAALVRAEARLLAGTAGAGELSSVRRAARSFEALGTVSTAVPAYLLTGRIAALLGRTRDAVAALRRASDLAHHTPVLVRTRGRVAAALAARLVDRDAEALAHCRDGLADLARHRTALPSVELRTLASGHGAELGQIGLEVVVGRGSPPRVLDWMERTRAAGLLVVEPTARAHADPTGAGSGAAPAGRDEVGPAREGIDDDLRELRAVHTELDGIRHDSDRRVAAPGPLIARQLSIESRIRRATWQRAAPAGSTGGAARIRDDPPLRTGTAVDLPRLRRLLDGRILVEYGVLRDRLLAVVLDRRRSRLAELGPTAAVEEQLRALYFALRRLSQRGPAAALAAARLSADLRLTRLTGLLLDPLDLPADAELVIVPVGPLHGVPWSALRDAPVSLAPSATFWSRTALAAHPGDGPVLLVAGPDLPGATAEVRALHATYPKATVLTPPDSTAAAVADQLGGATLAHLACHGRLRADNPMFSALLLADGPLTVQELETRGVAPYRLVLASCESGADVSYAGDEVLGFVSALLARGTAGIVASIAAIPDLAAVELMRGLHERLARGGTLAHALHGARGALDRDRPDAFVNWCTFSAHGAA